MSGRVRWPGMLLTAHAHSSERGWVAPWVLAGVWCGRTRLLCQGATQADMILPPFRRHHTTPYHRRRCSLGSLTGYAWHCGLNLLHEYGRVQQGRIDVHFGTSAKNAVPARFFPRPTGAAAEQWSNRRSCHDSVFSHDGQIYDGLQLVMDE